MPATAPHLVAGDFLPGTKYRVVRELGAGGMGVVYHVVKAPEIHGVLKLMSKDLAGTPEFRTRFFDEVRILAQLDHPNIVRVFDYDALTDGTPYYVMELLNGRTLRDAMATMGRLPPRVAFEITRQLLEALHAAHTHDVPVVHRDIKPENIFLHAPRHGEPTVKLIDFGVIAVADRKHDGMFVGTWRYAAPEQIRGERATPATDLYAVGLVLYEMLGGRGPFDHFETGSEVSMAHLRDVPAPVSTIAPWVPPSVVQLINASLSKDPRGRPRDAYAFAERLYELEWANDGTSPPEATSEGPLIKRVLETIGAARPSNRNQAAAPVVPLINVPPEDKHQGNTLEGIGGRKNATTPDEDSLLEGLAMRPDERVPSKKSRESGESARIIATPTPGPPGQVVIRPSNPQLPRAPTAATVDSDTFASQHSDPRAAPVKRSRGFWLGFGALGLMVIALLSFAIMLVKLRAKTEPAPATTVAASVAPPSSPPPPATTSAVIPEPPPVVAPSASVAVDAKPRAVVAKPTPKTSAAAPVTTTTQAAPHASTKPRDDFMRGGP
jgi:eukaryotic-like serine/threonine-protein kinase